MFFSSQLQLFTEKMSHQYKLSKAPSTAGSELENFIFKFPRLFVCLQMFYFFAILYKHLPGFPPFCLSVWSCIRSFSCWYVCFFCNYYTPLYFFSSKRQHYFRLIIFFTILTFKMKVISFHFHPRWKDNLVKNLHSKMYLMSSK